MACYSQSLPFELPPLPNLPRSSEDASNVLLSVRGLLGKEVNLDEFLQTLVDRVAAAMQADRGTLYLLDPARRELFSRAAHLPEIPQIRLKLGQGAAGFVAQHGVSVNMPDPRGDQQFFGDIDRLTGYRTESLLAVPIRDQGGALFGVLQVLNGEQGRFTDEDTARLEAIASQVAAALQQTSLYLELERAKDQPSSPVGYLFNNVVGESEPMRAAYRVVQKAANTDATVLITGESGCGKELFARALHFNSARRARPFVKVDCAALPASLVENELFGHEKGAFTGADQRVGGKFEAADGGTVFIDEIGELPPSIQGKLLRVLQDREFERVGGTNTVRVDVRILAATNRDLARMVQEGRFREDLYYRVKVVELSLPPLRDRGGDDIERLARHFLGVAGRRHHLSKAPKLSLDAISRLRTYRWPGNVRQLEHCIESAVVLSDGEILPEHLPLPHAATGTAPPDPRSSLELLTLAEVERRHIATALQRLGGNRTAVAKALGIGRNTLARKIREYNLDDS